MSPTSATPAEHQAAISPTSAPTSTPAQELQQSTPIPIAPRPLRPGSSSASISSPNLVSSRPHSPSSPHGSVTTRSHPHIRRPSSSMSSSSWRAYLTPDPSLPQRLPPSPPTNAVGVFQELEAEQEFHVNRLLHMIRIQSMQSGTSIDGESNAATVDSASTRGGRPRSPMSHKSSNRLSRDGSFYRQASISRASSPGFASTAADSASEVSAWNGSRDANFYIAENTMVKRENEMLRMRIRELEKAVAELSKGAATTASSATPATVPEEAVAPSASA
ncbi:hypothetical protein BZA77DRAFT_107822 [Pyronema omphalodes]|nr:hypothetical protein BZA77DRAFT_107822 [Pyronema omphalodes]